MKKAVCFGVMLALMTMALGEVTPFVALANDNDSRAERLAAVAIDAMDAPDVRFVENEAIVSFEVNGNVALAKEGKTICGGKIKVEKVNNFGDFGEGKDFYTSLVSSTTLSTQEIIKEVSKFTYVKSVSGNQIISTSAEPLQKVQWYLDGESTIRSGKSVGVNYSKWTDTPLETPVVAILDTGVDYTHEDLVDSMWINPMESEDLPGKFGYDYADGDDDPMDEVGHGTHVAGIVAATNDNNIGITGISNSKIMSLKVTEEDTVDISDDAILSAFRYCLTAKKNGVNLCAINCSWGGNLDAGGVMNKIIEELGDEGIICVFSAGNNGMDWSEQPEYSLMVPYSLKAKNVIIVGGTDENDNLAEFSDISSDRMHLCAPATDIVSTYNKNFYTPQFYDKEKREKLTMYYNTFSDSEENILIDRHNYKELLTAEDIGLETDYKTEIRWLKDPNGNDEFIALDTELLTFESLLPGYVDPGNTRETSGSIYIDVTEEKLDPLATYYVSFLNGVTYSTEDKMYWESGKMVSSPEASRFYQVGDKVYFRLIGIKINSEEINTSTMYFDDIAVSKANPNEEEFGKYFMMNGTSMATPLVTGASAIMRAINPTLKAEELREKILNCVREVKGLEDKCITGGVLDMEKIMTYHYIVWESDGSTHGDADGNYVVEKETPEEPEIVVDDGFDVGKYVNSFVLEYQMEKKAGKSLLYKKLQKYKLVGTDLTWTVDKAELAKVSKKGVLTINKKAAGKKITVSASGYVKGIKVSVTYKIKVKEGK